MEEKKLEQQIFDAIVEKMDLQECVDELEPEKLSYDTPLFESLDPDGLALDSIAALELVVILQDTFHVVVNDEDMKKLTSVSSIATFIQERRA